MKDKLLHVLLTLLCICSVAGCMAQIGTTPYPSEKPKKLELSKYEDIGKKRQEWKCLRGDTIYKLTDKGDVYQESVKKVSELFETISVYGKNDLSLRSEGKYFKRCPFGVHKFYEEGKILEKNLDINYPFTIDMLIETLKSKLKIDPVQAGDNLNIARTGSDETRKFQYTIYHKFESNQIRWIVLDGATGEIIDDKIEQYVD